MRVCGYAVKYLAVVIDYRPVALSTLLFNAHALLHCSQYRHIRNAVAYKLSTCVSKACLAYKTDIYTPTSQDFARCQISRFLKAYTLRPLNMA
jgi:hypothetical protein